MLGFWGFVMCKFSKRGTFSQNVTLTYLENYKSHHVSRALLMLLKGSTKSKRRDQEEGREAQKICLIYGHLQLAQSKTSLSRPAKASEMKSRGGTETKHLEGNTSYFIPTLWSTGIGSASKQVTKVWNTWCCITVALSYLDFPKAVQTHWEDLGAWRNCHALQSVSHYAPITRLLWSTAWLCSWGMNLWGSSELKG